jgi:hypothetical protein
VTKYREIQSAAVRQQGAVAVRCDFHHNCSPEPFDFLQKSATRGDHHLLLLLVKRCCNFLLFFILFAPDPLERGRQSIERALMLDNLQLNL